MIYCCETHVEMALDDIVERSGEMPIFEKIKENKLSTACSYCKNLAAYTVSEQ
ncbi:CxxH/CxxC protein [Thalassorhabdus alkalitolerans]|uniref:CxxH/CxxC protein n=1 Tax=Thalassorhabdus alkalitolerans TaxID=2282697 RepID=A0ABW0YJN6_9BACI